MNCPNCGNYLAEGSASCPNCGAIFNQQTPQQPPQQPYQQNAYQQAPRQNTYQQQYQQPYRQPYQQPQQNAYQQQYQQPYQQQYNPYAQNGALNNSEISSSKTLGIISIVCAFLGFHLVGIILGAIGNSKMKRILALNPANYDASEAKKLCRIGLILSIVFTTLTVVSFIAFFVLTAIGIVAAPEIADQIANFDFDALSIIGCFF